jgi:hypothetical protein
MMKKASVLVIALLSGAPLLAAAHDSGSVVTWRNIVGVITAPGVDNPVAVITQGSNVLSKVSSGTLPWVTRTGSARVDLASGAVEFSVRGLVLVGGNGSGTPGPINQVTGTLVCNPGSTDFLQPQAILDTPPVALSALGDADFSGELTTAVPAPCDGPLFLIRIGPDFGSFAGLWLATGVEPRVGRSSDSENRRDFDRD